MFVVIKIDKTMLYKNFTDFLMLGYVENNKHDKIKIQIKDEIIPDDYDRNLNYVNWTDTDAGFNFPSLQPSPSLK